ncbi:bifunctional aspartate transaminase/aspartate 4-decarboxylase [Paraflavitalea speifideaquila]|uniref:bifunctional aspartate transaminase/aspartate 4-decarboxylase n=1 Tax=Paraflavitalea speifideaquila TaxID=3076558 RepID=UPI0028EDB001|nr:bifunctional aspartate transaminase/aspartate 4-decarboxylase [Paraflavitalea speifideiaquila]
MVKKRDTIALMVPTFTPYIEIPELERYEFNVVKINASSMNREGRHTWQYPDSELDKLKDPAVKILFVVNPSNPPSAAIHPNALKKIVQIIRKHNPNLAIVTDDVYGTFVPGFRSLMSVIPENTIGVYSFSKYFGCTGWRLGVIAIHEDNIFDTFIAKLPPNQRKVLNKRYGTITLEPESLLFIDRMVADSRQVALNHTAGLSLPQQMQMMLFSAFALLDKRDKYKNSPNSWY